jgi:CheY-like chemotaxis protein
MGALMVPIPVAEKESTVTSPTGRILCVDDDSSTCEMVSHILKNYKVISVQTKGDALRLISEQAFDAIILDYHLPDGDGLEICRFVRLYDPSVPILFISSDVELTEMRVLKAGAQGMIRKGLDLVDTLASKIEHYRAG